MCSKFCIAYLRFLPFSCNCCIAFSIPVTLIICPFPLGISSLSVNSQPYFLMLPIQLQLPLLPPPSLSLQPPLHVPSLPSYWTNGLPDVQRWLKLQQNKQLPLVFYMCCSILVSLTIYFECKLFDYTELFSYFAPCYEDSRNTWTCGPSNGLAWYRQP